MPAVLPQWQLFTRISSTKKLFPDVSGPLRQYENWISVGGSEPRKRIQLAPNKKGFFLGLREAEQATMTLLILAEGSC